MKIAFDVGGVISKYPQQFRHMMISLKNNPYNEVFVISDMHPKEKIIDVLKLNNFIGHCIDTKDVYSADYAKYGEYCKARLCEQLGIDILVDDFVGYVADGSHIRLLVMPDSTKPYWSDNWKTSSESDFGRRYCKNKIERS